MPPDPRLNMPRFYLRAAAAVLILAGLSSLRLPREFALGVIAGGALSIINLREMHKGLRVILRMERPSAGRLWFSAIFRLLILASVITLIAMLKAVNMLGLLIGFAVVPAVLAVEGLMYARRLQGLEEGGTPAACSRRPRQ